MKNNKLITKSNELNEARYKLSLLEQKIILAVLTKIQPNDIDFKIYRFSVKELITLLDLKGQSLYSDLKKVTRDLKNRELIILNTEKKTELITNWFSSVKYFHSEGYIQFRFDPELKPYLLQLKERFVSYHLKNIVQLKSSYSIRLYELLKQYERIGHRELSIVELKKILGIQQDEYLRYTHFKSRVILTAQKELPEKTDIDFSFEEIKSGREVSSIKFIITKKEIPKIDNPKKEVKSGEDNPDISSLIDLLPEEQREKKTILEAISKYLKKEGFSYVERNIIYTNDNKPKKYREYLLKSLSEDWGIAIQEDNEAKKKIEDIEKEKLKLEELQKEAEKKIEKKIEEYIERNEDQLKEEALLRLDDELKTNDAIGRIALIGMMNTIAKEKLKIESPGSN